MQGCSIPGTVAYNHFLNALNTLSFTVYGNLYPDENRQRLPKYALGLYTTKHSLASAYLCRIIPKYAIDL